MKKESLNIHYSQTEILELSFLEVHIDRTLLFFSLILF